MGRQLSCLIGPTRVTSYDFRPLYQVAAGSRCRIVTFPCEPSCLPTRATGMKLLTAGRFVCNDRGCVLTKLGELSLDVSQALLRYHGCSHATGYPDLSVSDLGTII